MPTIQVILGGVSKTSVIKEHVDCLPSRQLDSTHNHGNSVFTGTSSIETIYQGKALSAINTVSVSTSTKPKPVLTDNELVLVFVKRPI